MEKQKHQENSESKEERLIRILSTDISGNKNVYAGLARIKGVSWGMSNAICYSLKIDKKRKIGSLSLEEIGKISEFIKNPKTPVFLMNRRKDHATGQDMHLTTTNLELRKEFDIKRLKKIKSYKGIRHILGQPVRGQRTRSHFRKNKTVGVQKKAKAGKKS